MFPRERSSPPRDCCCGIASWRCEAEPAPAAGGSISAPACCGHVVAQRCAAHTYRRLCVISATDVMVVAV
eukprot:5497502-Pyramimonas_sp.AAC.1